MSRDSGAKPGERLFEGVGIAPGIAIGPAHVVESGTPPIPEYRIPAGQVAKEKTRFQNALERARAQLVKLRSKARTLPPAVAEDLGYLLDAHAQMLNGSRLVRGVEARISSLQLNAEAAVRAETWEIARGFEALPDEYLAARAQDVREVGERVVRCLLETPVRALAMLPKGSVIVAEELTPAEAALMDPRVVAGVTTIFGGAEGHTAIMARSLGLPAVFGVPALHHAISAGDTVIVDGVAGRVIVNPTPATLKLYETRRTALQKEQRRLGRLRDVPAVTRDGAEIALQANLELPREVAAALDHGAQGIGLLRTEFMFMNRETPPDETEQYEYLRQIVEGMRGRPVTIRTLDAGGEKLVYSVGDQFGAAVNPALGLRAIRLSLRQRPLFEQQIAAILRAGSHGPVRILLPMISSISEVRQVRDIVRRVARRLKRRGVAIADPLPPLGVMVEVPGAALAADALAGVADFFAIGTNDLTMYTLAIDRAEEQVAHLYNPLHPAVLRLIQFSVQAALRARIPVCVCGEMAGSARYTALLLGLGVRDLSMTAPNLPRVKQRIRQLDLMAATMRAQIIMEQVDSGRIAMLLDDFNALA